MKELKIFLSFLVILIFLSPAAHGGEKEVGVLLSPSQHDFYEKLRSYLPVYLVNSYQKTSVCAPRKLIILGIEAYFRAKDISCPGQKRYLAGVLYPDLIVSKKDKIVIVSPLPAPKLLEPYGQKFSTVYSSYLSYYVTKISKFLDIKAIKISSLIELPEALKQAKTFKKRVFLLLPDPIFIDNRGQKIFNHIFCKDYSPMVLDLIGLKDLKCTPKSFPFPYKAYIQTLIKAVQKERGLFLAGEDPFQSRIFQPFINKFCLFMPDYMSDGKTLAQVRRRYQSKVCDPL